MANALSLPYKSLHLYGSPQGPTQPRSAVRSYCPFDSPWDNDAANTGRMDDMSVSMNLDDFIPLDELLDASLHSLDSACSDRTTFQVMAGLLTNSVLPAEVNTMLIGGLSGR